MAVTESWTMFCAYAECSKWCYRLFHQAPSRLLRDKYERWLHFSIADIGQAAASISIKLIGDFCED